MSQEFDAIYERGTFRPLQPVDLPEQTKVHLKIQVDVKDGSAPPADEAAAQNASLRELLGWVDGRPSVTANDNVSARDHDRIIYGWQK